MNNKLEQKYSIYYLLDGEDIPYYVGRTNNIKRRIVEHKREAFKGNGYKNNKLRKLINEGVGLKFKLVFEDLSFEKSVENEISEIKSLKAQGFKLTNLTEGGEGLNGMHPVFSEEWKQKLKDAKKKQYENGYVQWNKGKTWDEILGSKEAAEQMLKTSGEKISKMTKDGTRKHNKGISLKEQVGEIRAKELSELYSKAAKKTFTGKKQSLQQIEKRMANSKRNKL
jgi:predicted GIY-YIG superfamily endonuclease